MPTSNLNRPPYQQYRSGPVKRPPHMAAEPPSKASVLRTRNFKKLAAASGGSEVLGSLLDLTVERLKALEEGREFSDEMAFYLETELQLQAGWFDQIDPPIPAEVTRRAEAELDHDAGDKSMLIDAASLEAASSPDGTVASMLDADTAASGSQASQTPLALPSAHSTPDVPALKETTVAITEDNDAVFAVRSENFALLTAPKGAKAGMARVLGCTPANISHILRGKRISRHQASVIENGLGLQEHWLDTRHAYSELPSSAVELLTGRPADAASAEMSERSAVVKPAGVGAVAAKPRTASAARADAAEAITEMAKSQASQPRALAPQVSLPDGPVMSERTRELLSRAEGQMGIVAEALVKILIEKSRAGQLSEEFAYRMLSQVMASS